MDDYNQVVKTLSLIMGEAWGSDCRGMGGSYSSLGRLSGKTDQSSSADNGGR